MTDHTRCHEIEVELRDRLREAGAFTLSERWSQQQAEIERLTAENKKLRLWAEDEQCKRHKAEEDRMNERSKVARLRATIRCCIVAMRSAQQSKIYTDWARMIAGLENTVDEQQEDK